MNAYDRGFLPPHQRRAPTFNPWWVRLPALAVSGAVLFAAALVALALAFQWRYAGRALPNLAVGSVALGGLTRAEAEAALEAHYTYPARAVFTFRDGDRFWQYRAAELGVALDTAAALDQAFSAGRSGSLLADLATQLSIWLNGRSLAPVIRYDEQITANRLAEIAAEINRPAADATLIINGTLVATTPGQQGRTLDIPATLEQVRAMIERLEPGGEIPLIMHESPPAILDAEAVAARARAALSGPVMLVADDLAGGTLGPWVATVEQIGSLLELRIVTGEDGAARYDVSAKADVFRSYLEGLAPGLVAPPQDARFHFDPDTRQLQVIKSAQNGRALDVDETLRRLEAAIFDPANRVVPMAFTYELPRYHNNLTAAELGITQLVGEATTYYTGSTQSRKDNIFEAMSRFDGLVIGPGEVFSFNYWLGDISPETGFVQGKIIYGGRTVDGVGGGVCQVSTTIFRAAVNAGFPITERHSHGYRVGFYELNNFPPGLDAAIFQPTADFKFLNDTPYHLLIETSVFPGQDAVQFRLYSTNPGRQVVLEGPVIRDVTPAKPTIYEANPQLQAGQSLQVDWAKEGADVVFTRRILDATGQEIRKDTIYTHYQPWAAVVQVPPGDPRLAQSG